MSQRPRVKSRRTLLATLAAAGAAAIILAVGAPASAHVHVDGDATVGGYAVLTLRAPTESDTASTVGLTITFPSDTPLTYAATQPKTGWTATVTTADLAEPLTDDEGNTTTSYVASVTWTATGDGIAPGEFDTFAVQVGTIPDVEELVFPVAQSYSDGTVVDWDEIASGDAEPDHPAPVLTVSPASDDTADTTDTAASDGQSSSDSGTATGLGIAGLVAGVLALIVAFVALFRGNRGSRASQS